LDINRCFKCVFVTLISNFETFGSKIGEEFQKLWFDFDFDLDFIVVIDLALLSKYSDGSGLVIDFKQFVRLRSCLGLQDIFHRLDHWQ